MRVLVACEESQRVCLEFRKLGHEAYSCDLLEQSGGHDLAHLNVDALQMLKLKWDIVIAHPPCTYLTVSGNRWFNVERYGEKAIEREREREAAAEFFMEFADCKCEHVAVENPIGYMSTYYRKPDQIIQPWMFGHMETKATCLWLKGLPLLTETDNVKDEMEKLPDKEKHCVWYASPGPDRQRIRSKTFPGIARAMASQWCEYMGMKEI